MQRLTEETRLDGVTQRQIISLAAELQRLEEEGATIQDLEAHAREVGIDPKYVRMAMGQVGTPPQPVQATATPPQADVWYRGNELALVALAAFALAQLFTLPYLMDTARFRAPSVLILPVLMGMAFGRSRSLRMAAVASFFAITLGTVIVTVVLDGLRNYEQLSSIWQRAVARVVMGEFALLCVGILITTGWQWLKKQMKNAS